MPSRSTCQLVGRAPVGSELVRPQPCMAMHAYPTRVPTLDAVLTAGRQRRPVSVHGVVVQFSEVQCRRPASRGQHGGRAWGWRHWLTGIGI